MHTLILDFFEIISLACHLIILPASLSLPENNSFFLIPSMLLLKVLLQVLFFLLNMHYLSGDFIHSNDFKCFLPANELPNLYLHSPEFSPELQTCRANCLPDIYTSYPLLNPTCLTTSVFLVGFDRRAQTAPRTSVYRKANVVFSKLALYVIQHHFCHILFFKIVTKLHPDSRGS